MKNMQKSITNNLRTYISLFSGAAVGCYGFKMEGFECIATNEIVNRRLNIQKYNNKCLYESGYIAGDIVNVQTKRKIRKELTFWKKKYNVKDLDVLIATPPCQGMSVANHKKGNEMARNSLVVESIKVVSDIRPRFFVFENVRSFLTSLCTDVDGKEKKIREAIELNLGGIYNIHYQVVNFKDYGNPSSRTRTLVLGVRKDLPEITPLDLMPDLQREITLRDAIGDLSPLMRMGSVAPDDIYHNFRPYAKHMLGWIKDLKEGESAFDNIDPKQQPHRVVGGKMVMNRQKNGDKYSRCFWDKPGACIHTRNDIFASQSTIHPSDNRVFSIRELMRLMSVPKSFRWSDIPQRDLNTLSLEQKQSFLKKIEMNIRQSLGEAVPTTIFKQIAVHIKQAIDRSMITEKNIVTIIKQNKLNMPGNLRSFLKGNLANYSYAELSKIVELANAFRLKHAAYYTRQDICFTLIKNLPDASKFSSLRILEPSVGTGNFLPLLIEKYKSVAKVEIDVIDIDKNAIELLKVLVRKLAIPKNIKINFINEDFLLYGKDNMSTTASVHYDIVVGNPPFGKLTTNKGLLMEYKRGKKNTKTSNLFSFFLEKSISLADIVALITPKSFLSSPEFNCTREYVAQFAVEKITDYGEKGFKGVKIETISLILNTKKKRANNRTLIESYVKNEVSYRQQKYICSRKFPYWLVYRDHSFDKIASKLHLGVFAAHRDRQITKKITYMSGRVRVLKSRNIGSNTIVNIPNYDSYVDMYDNLLIAKYVNYKAAVLVPNLTYYPRACFLPENTLVDGSVAVLIPKGKIEVTKSDLAYYNSKEFTEFYKVARNYGTRSLNIDNNSVFFFGLTKSH